ADVQVASRAWGKARANCFYFHGTMRARNDKSLDAKRRSTCLDLSFRLWKASGKQTLIRERDDFARSAAIADHQLHDVGERYPQFLSRVGCSAFDNQQGIAGRFRHFTEVCLEDVQPAEQ